VYTVATFEAYRNKYNEHYYTSCDTSYIQVSYIKLVTFFLLFFC